MILFKKPADTRFKRDPPGAAGGQIRAVRAAPLGHRVGGGVRGGRPSLVPPAQLFFFVSLCFVFFVVVYFFFFLCPSPLPLLFSLCVSVCACAPQVPPCVVRPPPPPPPSSPPPLSPRRRPMRARGGCWATARPSRPRTLTLRKSLSLIHS